MSKALQLCANAAVRHIHRSLSIEGVLWYCGRHRRRSLTRTRGMLWQRWPLACARVGELWDSRYSESLGTASVQDASGRIPYRSSHRQNNLAKFKLVPPWRCNIEYGMRKIYPRGTDNPHGCNRPISSRARVIRQERSIKARWFDSVTVNTSKSKF